MDKFLQRMTEFQEIRFCGSGGGGGHVHEYLKKGPPFYDEAEKVAFKVMPRDASGRGVSIFCPHFCYIDNFIIIMYILYIIHNIIIYYICKLF
jgi:hypothetical protein